MVFIIYLNIKFSFTTISLVITYLYVMQKLTIVIQGMNQSYGRLNQSLPEFERVMNFLKNEKIIVETGGSLINSVLLKKIISFKNVFLKYKNNYVLNNITLDIFKGDTVALVGESGSGKTSMANLIVRLYDPSDGEILIDGVNTKKFDICFYIQNPIF